MGLDRTKIAAIKFDVWRRTEGARTRLYPLKTRPGDEQGYRLIPVPDTQLQYFPHYFRVYESNAPYSLRVEIAAYKLYTDSFLKRIEAFIYVKDVARYPNYSIYTAQKKGKGQLENLDVWVYECVETSEIATAGDGSFALTFPFRFTGG